MSLKNQIEVSFENDYLKIVNTDGVNPNFYKLAEITHIHSRYLDQTALNTYSPGHCEFDEDLKLCFRVGNSPSENVIEEIQIHNVTNQPTWTKDKAGLDKAVADLTLVSGSGSGGGLDTTLAQVDMSAIGATEEIVIPFYTNSQWSIQFEWNGLDANDATIDLLVSNNNTDFENLDGFSTITMDPIPDDSASVSDDNYDFNYLKILITKNSVTAGTVDFFVKR